MNKNLLLALICIGLIAVITLASGSEYGFTVEGKSVESLERAKVFKFMDDKSPVYSTRMEVYAITVTNRFMPRSYPLPEYEGCFYDSKTGSSEYAPINADVQNKGMSRYGSLEVGIGETKTAKYYLEAMPRYKEDPGTPFDYLLLVEGKDCYSLMPSDFDSSVKIPII